MNGWRLKALALMGSGLLASGAACSGGGPTTAVDAGADARGDTVSDRVATTDGPITEVHIGGDVGTDPGTEEPGFDWSDSSPDNGEDAWSAKPCQSHSDCPEGFCVELIPGSGETFCTVTCVEECPLDWVCKSVYVDGPDPVSVCLPGGDTLCKVCQKDKDCLLASSLCIRGTGALGYCGKVCAAGGAGCPEGFACAMYVTPEGKDQGYQCMPASPMCCEVGKLASCDDGDACTVDACDPSFGCTHEKASGDDTLNGLDDDCDGQTDEEAYKGFRLAAGSFIASSGKAEGGDLRVFGTLSAPFHGSSGGAVGAIVAGIESLLGLGKE
jgi:hypothetical protein